MGKVTPSEWRTAMVIALAVLLFSSLPYALGYLGQTPDSVFGGAIIDPEDTYRNMAAMQLGARGDWTYHMLYTPEEHRGVLAYTVYMALGRVSGILGVSMPLTYHLARVTAGVVLLLIVYRFVAYFLQSRRERLLAYLLAAVGSGLGWLPLLAGSTVWLGLSPIDLWLIDGYVFLTVLTFPHMALSTGLLLLTFMFSLELIRSPRPIVLLGAGFCSFLLAAIHPFHMVLLLGLLAAHAGLRSLLLRAPIWPGARNLLWLGLASAPVVAYYLHVLESEPAFQVWAAQNVLLSPAVWHYLLGYAPFLPLAVAGAAVSYRRRSSRDLFLLAWLGMAPLLLYFPFNHQQRMATALPVILAIAAARGWYRILWPRISRARLTMSLLRRPDYSAHGLRRLGMVGVLALASLSNLYVLASAGVAVLRTDEKLFRPNSGVAAVDWLGAHAAPGETVLAAYETGSFIPARIGHRVFMGHWTETLAVTEKRRLAGAFYQAAASDGERRAMLDEYGIVYVFHGPEERALGNFTPQDAPYLAPAYANSEVTIYRVDASITAERTNDG